MDDALLARYAKLIVEFGANIQPGQSVLMIGAPTAAPLFRAVAAAAYARGAKFFDPWYFDPVVKRIRAERAPEDSLEFVPSWYGQRLKRLGEGHGSRISVAPNTPPGLMAGVDPARAGRDQLPALQEHSDVINDKTTNWCVVPWATVDWARVVYPDLDDDAALAKLWEQLLYVLRLDEPDAAAAWRTRIDEIHEAAKKLDDARLDALHFEGPGTDLRVGLLPPSRWRSARFETIGGIVHMPNLPSEEIFTAPDPARVEGVVRSTKPLVVGGTIITGLRVRFEGGRAVSIDADEGGELLASYAGRDDGAARLGEVALVDAAGRIGPLDTVFYDTLIDENAASHVALGSAYEFTAGEEDRERINRSQIHVDFMIGSPEVDVTGIDSAGERVPVLRAGVWCV